MAITLTACLLASVAVHAGRGVSMKCQAKPDRDAGTGKTAKPCGYGSPVTFGGGQLSSQITGYCRACKKFVYLHWTRKDIPNEMKARLGIKARRPPRCWHAEGRRVQCEGAAALKVACGPEQCAPQRAEP